MRLLTIVSAPSHPLGSKPQCTKMSNAEKDLDNDNDKNIDIVAVPL